MHLDLDECLNPRTCAHIPNTQCVNRIGSYRCTCNPGYKRTATGCQGGTKNHHMFCCFRRRNSSFVEMFTEMESMNSLHASEVLRHAWFFDCILAFFRRVQDMDSKIRCCQGFHQEVLGVACLPSVIAIFDITCSIIFRFSYLKIKNDFQVFVFRHFVIFRYSPIH